MNILLKCTRTVLYTKQYYQVFKESLLYIESCIFLVSFMDVNFIKSSNYIKLYKILYFYQTVKCFLKYRNYYYYYLFYLLPDSVPFSGLYRLLPIYIGKIPIRGKNLSVFFQLVLCVLPLPNLYIFVSFICFVYYTS